MVARPAVRRRAAAALLAGAALGAAAPTAAGAAGKTVGVVYPETCGFLDAATDAFKRQLAAGGFGPDQAEIYVQKPAADPASWANAVRKFTGVGADLIVVYGDTMLQVACREKSKVPVAYGFVLEPGLAACARSAQNPGGNATGVSGKTPLATLLAKARLMTDFKTVGAMAVADDKTGDAVVSELRAREKELGYTTVVIPVAKPAEAVAALRSAPPIDLLLVPGCPLGTAQVDELLAVAAEKRIATVSLTPPRGAAPLLGLYVNPEEQGRLLGEMAVEILKGGAPSGPLVSPRRIEFEVNIPLARQLGVKLPMALLESATKTVK